MSTELNEVSKAVAEFDRVGAGLAQLRSQYQGIVFDVTSTKGMNEAKAARAAIREPRYEIERIRKAAKAPILALGKKLDSEAARITAELEKLEQPIDEAIKSEEARKERERQERIEAEQKRVAELQDRVAYLRGCPNLSASSGSKLIAEHIADLEAEPVDESLQEFQQQGADAKAAGLSRLRELHAAALAHEAEQERIKAEREELARLRKAEEERQAAERARLAEEERVARAAREAEAARQAEELRKQREAQEAENARVRAEQEAAARAERDRIAAEQKRLAEERAEFARQQEQARLAREAEEREKAEQARLANLKRPEDAELVAVLAKHYRVPDAKVIEWLAATNWKKAKAA